MLTLDVHSTLIDDFLLLETFRKLEAYQIVAWRKI